MLINDYNRVSKYPFIEASSLALYRNHKLSPGVITGASIYPCVSGTSAGYAYIAGISASRISEGVGVIRIYDSIVGDINTNALFRLNADSGIMEGSVIQNGNYCGVVTATADLLPLLTLNIEFEQDSFIFTPSVYHPRLVPAFSAGVAESSLMLNDHAIKSVTLDADDFDGSGNIKAPIQSSLDAVRAITINKLNTIDAKDSGLIVMASPGSYVRTFTDRVNSVIEIGGADDLSTQ